MPHNSSLPVEELTIARLGQLCDRVARVFARRGIQAQALLETLPETRQWVFARHYPEMTPGKPTCKRAERT